MTQTNIGDNWKTSSVETQKTDTTTTDSMTDSTDSTQSSEEKTESHADPPTVSPPSKDHPAVEEIAVEDMILSHPRDDWMGIPHPDNIETLLEENVHTEQTVLPDKVDEAITEIEESEHPQFKYLVMTPKEVYEYLKSLQWKSDLHLENFERQQVIINQLSNGNRNGQKTTLKTYDKKALIQWEVTRRLHNRDFDEWKAIRLNKENKGLPKA